jgi:hypothetical protein
MADADKDDEVTVVPLPGEEDAAEHERIRKSNDRDQQLEREGKISRHNRGYDQAVKGRDVPEIERVTEE